MTFNRRRQKEVKVHLFLPKEPTPPNSMAINGGRWGLRGWLWEGCGLGPFAAMLQSLHLDTPLLEQQNTKKLYGTTNNCMHAQWGQILAPKETKKKKNPAALKEPGGKTCCWEQKQDIAQTPLADIISEVGKAPKPPLWPHG